MSAALETLPTEITPLTTAERIRLSVLERQIEKDLGTFLSVAKCMAEIRSSRLYREHYPDFSSYCRERFCLARSSVDCLIRSGETAQLLIENGAQIPAGVPEIAIRPLSGLPSQELQTASWKLVQAACPDRLPTGPVSSKIVRAIRNAIEPEGTNGNGHKPRSKSHPSRERPFVQAAQRLSAYDGFDAGIVTAHIEKLPSAWSVYSACSNLIERCKLVQERLVDRFPELANA
jgi:hypothetical protein